jgi:hypothetical protein
MTLARLMAADRAFAKAPTDAFRLRDAHASDAWKDRQEFKDLPKAQIELALRVDVGLGQRHSGDLAGRYFYST